MVQYDFIKKVLFGQWNDNNVVSFISILGVLETVSIQCRVGANIKESLKHYKKDNFMGSVYNVDKDKKLVVCLPRRPHLRNGAAWVF